MGQQVSVETFASSADKDGNNYWTSFDPYPFKVGSRKLVYMGLLNGDGPLKGHKCVVKTMRRGAMSRRNWMLETRRARVAADMADSYNRVVLNRDQTVRFLSPIMAEIDTLSDCMCVNDVLGKPRKGLKESDYVSIEVYLKGRFEDFEYGWVSPSDLIVPEAFSHFTWCRSEGSLLVSNLQGVKNSSGYQFTGPTVHSEQMIYGSSDLGLEGIKGFFALHKCNDVCRNWPRLGDGVDLRGRGEFIGIGGRSPSAPPLPPQPPPYQEHSETDHDDPHPGDLLPAPDDCHGNNMYPPTFGGQPMGPNWQTEFMNQMAYVISNGQLENGQCRDGRTQNGFQNPLFGMQLMWIVKQMSYTGFQASPPPYCRCHENAQAQAQIPEIASRQHVPDHRQKEYEPPREIKYFDDTRYFRKDSDKEALLPPPYSEESVEPEYDCITYL